MNWNMLIFGTCLALLVGCGGGSDGPGTPQTETETPNSSSGGGSEEPEDPSEPEEPPAPSLQADAGEDRTVAPGVAVSLDASASSASEGGELTYRWTLGEGSDAFFLDDQGRKIDNGLETVTGRLFVPAAHAGETLPVYLQVDDGESTSEQTLTLTVDDCPGREGYVFVDCAAPTWAGVSAWQMNFYDSDDYFDSYDGDTEEHVRWSVVTASERGSVLDVRYTKEDFNGILTFRVADFPAADVPAEQAIDWRAFEGGQLVFDMRVIELGDAADMRIKVECIYPCESTEFVLDAAPEGEWKTFSIPVDELTDRGLDLSQLSIGFQLLPTWGQQQGVHVQLDNVRWDKADCGEPEGVIFDDCLGPRWTGMGAWDSQSNQHYLDGDSGYHISWESMFTGDAERDYVLDIGYHTNASGNFYFYTDGTFELTDYLNGQLVFDLKVLEYSTQTSEILLKLRCGESCDSGDISAGRPPVNEWTTVEIDVADILAGSFNTEESSVALLIFPTWFQQEGTRFLLDNVRWEE